MVRHPALRKVIGPYLFTTVAGADLGLACRGLLSFPFLPFFFQQAGLEDLHCFLAVFKLRPFILAGNNFAGGYVGDSNGRVSRVYALSAGARSAVGIYAQ